MSFLFWFSTIASIMAVLCLCTFVRLCHEYKELQLIFAVISGGICYLMGWLGGKGLAELEYWQYISSMMGGQ